MSEKTIKVIFLNVEGVLSTARTQIVSGKPYDLGVTSQRALDWCGIGLVKRITQLDKRVRVVITSDLRWGRTKGKVNDKQAFGTALKLPVYAVTLMTKTSNTTQQDIGEWLENHRRRAQADSFIPKVSHYAVLDTFSPLHAGGLIDHYISINELYGITVDNYYRLKDLLGIETPLPSSNSNEVSKDNPKELQEHITQLN